MCKSAVRNNHVFSNILMTHSVNGGVIIRISRCKYLQVNYLIKVCHSTVPLIWIKFSSNEQFLVKGEREKLDRTCIQEKIKWKNIEICNWPNKKSGLSQHFPWRQSSTKNNELPCDPQRKLRAITINHMYLFFCNFNYFIKY